MTSNKSLIASSIALTLITATSANASLVTGIMGNGTWSTNHANFTMLDQEGATTIGGANNVNMVWDGNAFTSSSDYIGPGSTSNITAASTSTFMANTWTVHDIQMFLPGSYSFDTALGGGNPESGLMNVIVPAGQLGMHMLFDIVGDNNIDIFVMLAQNTMFGEGVVRTADNADDCDLGVIQNCLWSTNYVTGFKPVANQVWTLASVDGNGDGIMGIPMAAGGPFAGFNANFNANLDFTPAPVPVPTTIWLFSSGLIGLLGAATPKKTNLGTSLTN